MKLPSVWKEGFRRHAENQLRMLGAEYARIHQLPEKIGEWHPEMLREKIMRAMRISVDHTLPLDCHETGVIRMEGYTIHKVCFQSRRNFLVTGNLYVPEGDGPFPAVINLHGHWSQGRLAGRVQERGHILARSGYVCLSIDAFGSGERATVHGEFEYHGLTLGGSLMNIGETLMGIQVADNMRGVDLLCSLPYVDASRIGATGASGGGNQTMWLAALDERIKAAVPVVSVGTFESYIMNANCICELLPGGLTFTEEAGVLALAAPRALKLCNGIDDANNAFKPKEMLLSFSAARKIFELYGASDRFANQIFNTPHGYWPEIQEAMLGWFDLHLRGIGHGEPRALPEYSTLPEEELMVFPKGKRPDGVVSIENYCLRRAAELKETRRPSREKLRGLLCIGEKLSCTNAYEHTEKENWKRFTLRGSDGRLIPLLLRPSVSAMTYTLVSAPYGKKEFQDTKLAGLLEESGSGIALFDPWGAGENDPDNAPQEKNSNYARSLLWLGMTMQGKWVQDYEIVADFLRKTAGEAAPVFAGYRDTALAALLAAALAEEKSDVLLEQPPESFACSRERRERFTMAWLIPDILHCADIPDLMEMAGGGVTVLDAV